MLHVYLVTIFKGLYDFPIIATESTGDQQWSNNLSRIQTFLSMKK